MSTLKGGAVRKVLALFLVAALLVAGLAACGGGSSSGGGGSGSGSGGTCCGTQVPLTAGPPNVEPLVIDSGPAAVNGTAVNQAFVSVQVCAHGSTTNCATIDHVVVDTGSIGFRVVADGIPTSLLTALQGLYQKDPGTGDVLTECVQFAGAYSYGSVSQVDITLPVSTESATGVNAQIIGDPSYATIPGDCSNPPGVTPAPMAQNTVATFGANGILGVGVFPNDCPACESGAVSGAYYSCPTPTSCTDVADALTTQLVQNPVVLFATDNNGTIMQLPAIANAGVSDLTTGVIVFGIGTRSNNALGSATVMAVNLNNASGPSVSATVNGSAYDDSFFDSGTNFLGISGPALPSSVALCTTGNTAFYCTSATASFTATAQGQDSNGTATGTMANADFSIADANTLLPDGTSVTAVPSLGGPNSDPASVDFGLPFFFGRYVYTGIMGQTVTGATTPFFAY
jgi:hypothetical protein